MTVVQIRAAAADDADSDADADADTADAVDATDAVDSAAAALVQRSCRLLAGVLHEWTQLEKPRYGRDPRSWRRHLKVAEMGYPEKKLPSPAVTAPPR